MKKLLFIATASTMLLSGCLTLQPKEVYIAHILVACPPNAPREVKSRAYRELFLARKAIELETVTFQQSALEVSNCPSKDKGGVLEGGWFRLDDPAIQKKYPKNFLKTAASLKKGKVSEIIQTKFGFHILKCYGRR